MARTVGSLATFRCGECGERVRVSGGTAGFICNGCRERSGKVITAKKAAHAAVGRAIKAGELQRPALFACVDCSGPAIEYDHRDYSKPLDVVPVCRRCNLRRGPAIGSDAYRVSVVAAMAGGLLQRDSAQTPQRS